jgi:2-hydroxy-6-oxonona-2,4-dienedioate hydrolase
VAALVLVAPAYERDLHAARERTSDGSEITQTRCGPIEYARVGSGTPVLFVHGAGGGFDQGLEMAERLAKTGFQVVLMSRFGYLRTPLPADASAAAQADAHACLLDALKLERAAIAGASAGAPSAMQFALRPPSAAARWYCWCRPPTCRALAMPRRSRHRPGPGCSSTRRCAPISSSGV